MKPGETQDKQCFAEGHFNRVDTCYEEDSLGSKNENNQRKTSEELETIVIKSSCSILYVFRTSYFPYQDH